MSALMGGYLAHHGTHYQNPLKRARTGKRLVDAEYYTGLSCEIDVPALMLMIDVDLPEIEDVPGRFARLAKDGRRLIEFG